MRSSSNVLVTLREFPAVTAELGAGFLRLCRLYPFRVETQDCNALGRNNDSPGNFYSLLDSRLAVPTLTLYMVSPVEFF